MPSDEESRNVDQDSAQISTRAPSVDRAAGPLGRGLEDISHLFLSLETRDPRARELAGERVSQRARLNPEPKAGTVLLRPCRPLTRDQLVATLTEFRGALEDDMRAIDANLSCHPYGEIDLLAADGANRLAIIDIETSAADVLLVRGISHVEWVMRNVANVRRMYQGLAIDFSLPPRLFLVAPQFSPLARSVVHQITRPEINCVRYHVMAVYDRTGVLFEHVHGEGE